MLCAEDLHLDRHIPSLTVVAEKGRGKSPGDVPIMPNQTQILKRLSKTGVKRWREVKNQHGKHRVLDKFVLPASGRLFPTTKSAKSGYVGVRGITKAIKKLALDFKKTHPGNGFNKLCSHSGRATEITLLMGEGVPLALTMKYARHAPASIRTHLKYGRLTVKDIYKYLDENRQHAHADPHSEPVKAAGILKRKAKQMSALNGLEGCTLKDLVEWHQAKLLSLTEFRKAKSQLPCFQGMSCA